MTEKVCFELKLQCVLNDSFSAHKLNEFIKLSEKVKHPTSRSSSCSFRICSKRNCSAISLSCASL